MSFQVAAVRFSQGLVCFAAYNGTADLLAPTLHQAPLEALEQGMVVKHCFHPEGCEPVEVAVDYGFGMFWRATVCPQCLVLVDGLNPYGDSIVVHEGLPDWYPAEAIREASNVFWNQFY